MKFLTAHKRRHSLRKGVLALVFAAVSSSAFADEPRKARLSDLDYSAVAVELDIPEAAIRAVVEIEAGPKGNGFNPDNTPIVNFDLRMFTQACKKRGIELDSFKLTHPTVFAPLDRKKYGTPQAAQYARLKEAMSIDTVAALEGTFWGMFQIGGFNWKLCGFANVHEFIAKMSESERAQLELFAVFLTKRNLMKYIREQKWEEFSLRYNGPGYKKHAYDTRLARAFTKYSNRPD